MQQTSSLFSERDRSLIEASNYDPDLKPNYNPLSSLLFWNDEAPVVFRQRHMTF